MNETFTQWKETLRVQGHPDEYEVKQLLKKHGIPCPKGLRLLPEDHIQTDLLKAPYVVKVCSGEILHKTEEGGVLLNLDENQMRDAINDMRRRFKGAAVLVEEQAKPIGPEFILGALTDPDFGLSVMAGAGGILTELYEDVTFRLAPLTQKEAADMLEELTVSPVLKGFRKLDLDGSALAHIITSVGDLASGAGSLFDSLDINPLVFTKEGWQALDAKLIWKNSHDN